MTVALIGRVDSFPRAPLPGKGMISLTHSGGYPIYYEGPGASNGYHPGFDIVMTPLLASAAVPDVEVPFSGSLTFQAGHREAAAVGTVQIARPGRFLVQTTSSAAPPGSYLAVGSNISGATAAIVFPALALTLAGIGGAITIAIVRHSAKRA